MRRTATRVLMLAIASFAAVPLLAAKLPPAPEIPLAEGPGRDVVEVVCTDCHASGRFALQRHSPIEWANIVKRMNDEEGAEISADDEKVILAYLNQFYAGSGTVPAPGAVAPVEGPAPAAPTSPPSSDRPTAPK